MNRRAYLTFLGVGGIASLSGCTGMLASGENGDGGESTMTVESGTNMEVYPHSPKGQPAAVRPNTYNHVSILNQGPNGQGRDFQVTVTGPNEELFDGTVRLESANETSTGLVFFVSRVGEYRCSVTVGDETLSKTWQVTEERLSKGGGMAIMYDGELFVRGGVDLSES